MNTAQTRPAPFDLSGGHPALDFVNSLDPRFGAGAPVELLTEYPDLLRLARQSGLVDARQARALARSDADGAARALRAGRELREALAAAFYAYVDGRPPPPPQLRTLEHQFRDAAAHRELSWGRAAERAHGGAAVRWEWGRFGDDPELPVWMLAQAAAELLASEAMRCVRACGAETCRWLFLDTSKNHTRRWCNMKVCGNRAKARRFQARRA